MSAYSNAQKIPVARTLNQFVDAKAQSVLSQAGKSLPATVVSVSGSIVTVKFALTTNSTTNPFTFQNITVPIVGSEYIRLPIQPGCTGYLISADDYLGGVSGLGGGTASLAPWGNLAKLVFFPIGNKGFSSPDNPNSLVLYGPDGAIIRDMNSKTVITLTASGVTINLQSGDAVTINGKLIVNGTITTPDNIQLGGTIVAEAGGEYSGNITTSGDVQAAGISLQTHIHPGVQSGPDDTGPPA